MDFGNVWIQNEIEICWKDFGPVTIRHGFEIEMARVGSSKQLLIVGGNGFIGRWAAYEGIRRGFDTTILSPSFVDRAARIQKVSYLVSDISNRNRLSAVLEGCQFTHVINLGGYINHSTFSQTGSVLIDTHFRGVMNLVEVLNNPSLQCFLQIGSSDEYGLLAAPQSENDVASPTSQYSLAKSAASQFLQLLYRDEQFPAVIVRLFLVYGPGQKPDRFLPALITSCINNQELEVSSGLQVRDFCHVKDVVRGLYDLIDCKSAKGEIFNLGSGTPRTIRSVIETVVDKFASKSPIFGTRDIRPGENISLYPDLNKARKFINWEARISFEDGLQETIQFYKEKIKNDSSGIMI